MTIRSRIGAGAKGVPRVPPGSTGPAVDLCDDNPEPVSNVTPSPGTSELASRCDHVHAHGSLLGGSLHALATTATAGFMSAADKTKLDTFGSLAEIDNGNSGAAIALSWSAGINQLLTLTANAAITFADDPAPGSRLLLRLVQGGGGGFNPASWPADVRWSNGNVAPVLTAAAGSQDILSLYYNGTNYYGALAFPNC